MKNILIQLFFFYPVLIFSQFNSSVEIMGGIGSSYRFIHLNNGNNGSNFSPVNSSSILDYRNDLHKAKMNGHFGIAYNKALKDNLHLKIGLQFSRFGYKSSYDDQLIFPDQIGPDGFDPSIESEIEDYQVVSVYDLHFSSIPFVIRYELMRDNKFRPFVEIGLHPTFFLNSRTQILINDEIRDDYTYDRTDVNENFNLFHLMGSLGFGLQYQLNQDLQLYALPNLRFMYTPLQNMDVVYTHLYTGGIELGLRKSIN